MLRSLPSQGINLVLTSPPYNVGKAYERKRISIDKWLDEQRSTFSECVRILADDGSLCWQVGNHIAHDGEVVPLDAIVYGVGKQFGLKLRNRIVWAYGHGLHCSKRFSGRHETILWFTKSDRYIFNLDAVRVPQLYPQKKFFRGPRIGQLSCNPLGKNPGDVWSDIPNVKNNHPEKTKHPCQFPLALAERLILALTQPNGIVVDPYMGVGTALCAAILHNRQAVGSDLSAEYCVIATNRIQQAINGTLPHRSLNKPLFKAPGIETQG